MEKKAGRLQFSEDQNVFCETVSLCYTGEGTLMLSQLHGYLKKTWIRPTPVDIPTYLDEISRAPLLHEELEAIRNC